MRALRSIVLGLWLLPMPAVAATVEYAGICEASAAAALDGEHFAAASDETNVVQVYKLGRREPIGPGIDFKPFTTFGKSDLEAAARIGSRVYWISSHSLTAGKRKDKKERKVFFASDIVAGPAGPTLLPAGRPVYTLRNGLTAAAGVGPEDLNIEGLAATPEGRLLIGLRGPLLDGLAVVVPFENPAEAIDTGAAPRFGAAMKIRLGGLGIRSIDLVGTGARPYVIVAGPVQDAPAGYVLYRWSGRAGDDPVPVTSADLAGLGPEAVVSLGGNRLLVLSDDSCNDEGPIEERRFRAREVELPSE